MRYLALLAALLLPSAVAQPFVDTSFGTDGFTTIPLPATANGYASAPLPDGGSVHVGAVADGPRGSMGFVSVLDARGQLDPAFGTDGVVTFGTLLGDDAPIFRTVAVASQNLIYAVGLSTRFESRDLVVVALNASGQPVTTFGVAGVARIRPNPQDTTPRAFAFDAVAVPGGLLIVGTADSIGSFVARVRADGSLDSTFGDGGVASQLPSGAYSRLALQPNGKIVVAGRTSRDWAVARLNADGAPDLEFGDQGGLYRNLFDGSDSARGVLVLDDGHILVSGASSTEAPSTDLEYGTTLALVTPDGQFSPSFGEGGMIWVDAYPRTDGDVGAEGGSDPFLTRDGYGTLASGAQGVAVVSALPNGDPDPAYGPVGSARIFDDRVRINPAAVFEQRGRFVFGGSENGVDGAPSPFVARFGLSGIVSSESAASEDMRLSTYPNPTRGRTALRLSLAEPSNVEVAVYDVLGRRVATLHDGPAAAGELRARWDASGVAPGAYVVVARGGDAIRTLRVSVIR